MNTLFISFLIAIASAVGLVMLSRSFDLDVYTSRVLPLIPILYAIVYEVLEKRKTDRTKPLPQTRSRDELKAVSTGIFQNITLARITTDVGVSLLIKFAIEGMLTAVYLAAGRQSFTALYGPFRIETVGTFLRGDHPWLTGSISIFYLTLIALITGLGTGLWIGYTSKGRPILEGVIAGAAVTVLSTMTNMIILYRQIEALTIEAADAMGYVIHVGFVVVITLQVLLYGLWSGMAYRAKCERQERAVRKKAK